MTAKSEELMQSTNMINSETDLKIFIDEHRTFAKLDERAAFEPYAPEPRVAREPERPDLVLQL